MSDSNEEKSGEGKKHIKFTKSVDEAEKEQISPRAFRGLKVPKHERESERFRVETLEQIRIFRAARKGWMESMVDTDVGTTAVDKGMERLEIDRRRLNLMKKLGLKVSMIRPHRKTLRPRIYFTFKRSLPQRDLAMAEAHIEARNAAINEKTKVALMKDFRKLAKNAADRMTEESDLPERKQKTAVDVQRKSFSGEQSGIKESEKGLGDVSLKEDEEGEVTPVKSEAGELTAQENDGLTSGSREEFNKIVEKLRTNPKYALATITDEDVDAMKKAWRDLHPVETEEIKVTPEKEEKKSIVKPKRRDSFKWLKKETWTRPKTELRPCSCPIVERDGVIILKSVCDCSGKLQGAKTVILESKNAGELTTQIPVVSDESDIPIKSSFSVDKIVDSLDMIRSKLPSRSLPTLQDQEKSDITEELAGEAIVPEEVPGENVMEEILSGESIPDNVKPVKATKSRSVSKISKSSGSVSSGKVGAKKKKPKSILGKKNCKKSKAGCTRVNFQDVEQQVGEEPKEESSSKTTKTVMSVVNIFKR